MTALGGVPLSVAVATLATVSYDAVPERVTAPSEPVGARLRSAARPGGDTS
jgi:hypothetical protein